MWFRNTLLLLRNYGWKGLSVQLSCHIGREMIICIYSVTYTLVLDSGR
jgi:hypothetical protein